MNNEIIRCRERSGYPFNICNRVNWLLNFINDTSETELRLTGYRTTLQKISSESIPRSTSLLSLQHFVSHDISIENSKFIFLLNEIESKTNDALESLDFDHLKHKDDCYYPYNSYQMLYMDYLIKRFCSTDPAYIKTLRQIFQGKSSPIGSYIQFVKELEQNNRLNYTIMVIPHLRSYWWQIKIQEETCQQLRQMFPQNSTLRHLLSSTNNKYLIKNAYSGEYLCYDDAKLAQSYYLSYKDERPVEPTNIFICPIKNSTWQFRGNNEFSIVSGHTLGRSIILEKCKLHNEWYVALSKDHIKKYGYEKLDVGWELEMTDIFNERLRFKSVTSGGYLRVGSDGKVLISMTDCNAIAERSEWILEKEEDFINADITCESAEIN